MFYGISGAPRVVAHSHDHQIMKIFYKFGCIRQLITYDWICCARNLPFATMAAMVLVSQGDKNDQKLDFLQVLSVFVVF